MAKKRSHAKPKKSDQATEVTRLPWLVTGITCGLGIALLIYFYPYDLDLTPKPNKIKKVVEVKEPQFDFYNLLPNMEVGVKNDSPETAPSKTVVADKPAVVTNYMVQVASYHHYNEADQLKAKLILDGYNPSIKKFEKNDKVWYRVYVGPCAGHDQARQIQVELKQQGLDTLLIKVS